MSETPTTTGEGFDALRGLGTQAEDAVAREPKIDAQGRAYATGKRKNAVARVWIKPGKGQITINGRDQEIYFARPVLRMMIAQPLLKRLTSFTWASVPNNVVWNVPLWLIEPRPCPRRTSSIMMVLSGQVPVLR